MNYIILNIYKIKYATLCTIMLSVLGEAGPPRNPFRCSKEHGSQVGQKDIAVEISQQKVFHLGADKAPDQKPIPEPLQNRSSQGSKKRDSPRLFNEDKRDLHRGDFEAGQVSAGPRQLQHYRAFVKKELEAPKGGPLNPSFLLGLLIPGQHHPRPRSRKPSLGHCPHKAEVQDEEGGLD
jgi:hypothetical protein